LGGAPPLFYPDQRIVIEPMGIAKLTAIIKFGEFKGQVPGLFVNKCVGVVDVHINVQ